MKILTVLFFVVLGICDLCAEEKIKVVTEIYNRSGVKKEIMNKIEEYLDKYMGS